MKIWYQALSPNPRVDPKWRSYDEACERYVPTLARAGTQIRFASTETRAPKMVLSSYVRYLHLEQIIENAIEAERTGYDAFVVGGMGDLGYAELREVVDIPVVFIAEAAFYVASMQAAQFAVINSDARALQSSMTLIKKYGLEQRAVAGGHIGYAPMDLLTALDSQPERVVEQIKTAARGPINEGAAILVPGVAPINVFLAERGIRDIDGVPILDAQAAVIKVTEMLVDFRKLGMGKPRKGPQFDVSKDDILAARTIYGIQ